MSMQQVKVLPGGQPMPRPKRRRVVDYDAKLEANLAASMRWTTKLKFAANKLARLDAQRRRILKVKNKPREQVRSRFARKFV